MDTIRFNGIKMFPFSNSEELLDYIADNNAILIALNAGKIGYSSDAIKSIINNNVGYADGIGAAIAMKKKGAENPGRITGCDLWLEIVNRFYKERTFYFVGASQEVIDCVVNKVKREYVGINIVNYRNGYFHNSTEKEALLNDIAQKKPQIVFVAMGSPMQEYLMNEMQTINPNAIYQGLGGSFDVYSGLVKRAPKWTKQIGVEGLYRGLSRIYKKSYRKRFCRNLIVLIKIKLNIIK